MASEPSDSADLPHPKSAGDLADRRAPSGEARHLALPGGERVLGMCTNKQGAGVAAFPITTG